MSSELRVWAPDGLAEIAPGDDLVALLTALLASDPPVDGDVLVLTSKVVSKAEGRVISADDREQAITDETVRVVATREHAGGVTRIVENRLGLVMAAAGVDASNTPAGTVLLLPLDPDASARRLRAGIAAADREQAITDETVRVVATREHGGGTTRIVENRLGLVMAAAGVDASNTPAGTVLLLPVDPDASARALRAGVSRELGVRLAVIVSDTAGRAWREGVTDVAIGAAGLRVLDDLRGTPDTFGRPLTATVAALADEIAAAAELVKGKASGRPVAVVRGVGHLVTEDDGPGARTLVRAASDDLFRLGSSEAYALGHADGTAGIPPTPPK